MHNIAKDLWEDNDFSQLIKAENEIKITSGVVYGLLVLIQTNQTIN